MNCPPLKLELKEIIFLFQTTPLLLQWNGVAVESPEDYFAVSDKGEISIIKGNQNIQPGKYILSFKLTTAAQLERILKRNFRECVGNQCNFPPTFINIHS